MSTMTLFYILMVPMIAFVPMQIPSAYLIDNKGLRFALSIGMILASIGALLKCLINTSITYAVIGQTIFALGSPIIINSVTKVSGNWFGDNERTISTGIGISAYLLGLYITYFVPITFMNEDSIKDFNVAK